MTPDALPGGFTAAPQQSARAFRAALEAMARPGTLRMVKGAIPPAPLSIAAGVLILTLCDGMTPLHLGPSFNSALVRDWVTFHTGAPLVAAAQAQFALGYGLVFGQTERKAIAMSLVDRALRWKELGEDFTGAPAQDEEFVLMHSDNIQATGFLEHIKLPHYVDFQAELELARKLRSEAMSGQDAAE